MNLLFNTVAAGVIASLLFFSGIFFNHTLQQQPSPEKLGATFTPAQIPPAYLSGSGITSTQNTVPLTTFLTRDGRAVAMTMLGSTGYGTLEPGSSKEEIISFTGITQNANGTAILTGVSRGLDFVTPYAASTTLAKAHAGNATFIISNTAPFYGQQFAFINNPTTIAAVWTYASTTLPTLDADLASWTGKPAATLVTKGYVDSVAVAGAPNADATTKGIVQLATASQEASSTVTGSSGANLAMWSKYATDTPQAACATVNATAGSGCTPKALLNGKLNQSWFDLTQTFLWSAVHTFTSGIVSNASTTIACASGKTLTLNGLGYVCPAAQAAGVLSNNGSGTLSWGSPARYSFVAPSTLVLSSNNTFATSSSFVIPANTLTASSTIDIYVPLSCSSSGGGATECDVYVRTSGGTTLGSVSFVNSAATVRSVGTLHAIISATSTTASQQTLIQGPMIQTSGTFAVANQTNLDSLSFSAVNLSSAQNLVVVLGVTTNISAGSVDNIQFVLNP